MPNDMAQMLVHADRQSIGLVVLIAMAATVSKLRPKRVTVEW